MTKPTGRIAMTKIEELLILIKLSGPEREAIERMVRSNWERPENKLPSNMQSVCIWHDFFQIGKYDHDETVFWAENETFIICYTEIILPKSAVKAWRCIDKPGWLQ